MRATRATCAHTNQLLAMGMHAYIDLDSNTKLSLYVSSLIGLTPATPFFLLNRSSFLPPVVSPRGRAFFYAQRIHLSFFGSALPALLDRAFRTRIVTLFRK
ncbi:hypothetical protein QCA50_005482 [Cerrena zonata]|uniref:Uncharacterized protein n=1 Tax=Cerrena zonata TaxID=2478898 RepID=A0AAW0GFD6_9APHY